MSDRFVLLDDRHVALIILAAVLAAVEQEFPQRDVLVPCSIAVRSVDEPAEADQRDLHGLMAVVPALLGRRSDVVVPAVSQPLGGIVQPRVLALGQQVVRHCRFQQVAGDVPFMVRSVTWRPALAITQRERGLNVPVRLLGGQDLGDPVVQCLLERFLSGDDLLVPAWVDHQGHADRFDRVVNPGVGEHITTMPGVRLTGQLLGRVHKVVDAAFPQIRIVDPLDTVRDPVDDQCLGAVVPKWAVNGVLRRVNQLQVIVWRPGQRLDCQF